MAVYTEVSDEELEAFMALYDLGEVLSCKGIAEGVENSNFLLVTSTGPYILTLYEKRVDPADLPFFLGLLEHLAEHGIPCPVPVHGRDGLALRELCDRPAVIVTFLSGMWPRRIKPRHCRELGQAMARLHAAGLSFPGTRPNALSVDGWARLFSDCADRADSVVPGLRPLLETELDILTRSWPKDLPTGVIHADLFPDNVFFRENELTGIIDFYFACTDALAYDLAICLNAWCFESDGAFNITKARQLLAGYQSERSLGQAELDALPILARGSAARFLLTRLYDWINHPEGAFVKPKNPLEYLQKLQFHQRITSPEAYGLDPVAKAQMGTTDPNGQGAGGNAG